MRRRLGGLLSILYPLLVLMLLKTRIPAKAALTLKLYPVAVNAVLLGVFSSSLLKPPSVIERMARLKIPELSARQVSYTRSVTKVWCAFFLLNGLTALATALWTSAEVWALYNGVISYILVGCLFAVERLARPAAMGAAS